MTILIVTNSNDTTVDFVEKELIRKEVDFIRFNTDKAVTDYKHTFKLNESLADRGGASILAGGRRYPLEDISSVWYRRPVTPVVSSKLRTEQAKLYAEEETYYYFTCLYNALHPKKWVSFPWAISRSNDKLRQLTDAQSLGFKIPNTLATNEPEEVTKFFRECNGEVVVKPFRMNSIDYGPQEKIGIYTSSISTDDMENIASVEYSIHCFQEKIVKTQDLRVTVIGEDLFSAALDSQLDENTQIDWRRTTSQPKAWRQVELPDEIAHKCRKLVKFYGLEFGAIDLAISRDNEYFFFEINPNGQWVWLEIETGMRMTESLLKALHQ